MELFNVIIIENQSYDKILFDLASLKHHVCIGLSPLILKDNFWD